MSKKCIRIQTNTFQNVFFLRNCLISEISLLRILKISKDCQFKVQPIKFQFVFVFQINQEHLRAGNQDGKSILNALPQTVSGNVKNVTGWRGGAERGFLSVYSDCIHVIRTEGLKFYSQDMITKYMKVPMHLKYSVGTITAAKKTNQAVCRKKSVRNATFHKKSDKVSS